MEKQQTEKGVLPNAKLWKIMQQGTMPSLGFLTLTLLTVLNLHTQFLSFNPKYIFFIHTGNEYIELTDYRYVAYILPSFLPCSYFSFFVTF